MISVVIAMDEKRGIGKDGKIPWHISEDLKRFKNLTMGHPIIMGRKTYESIGRVLPGRINIIVTRDLGFKINDLINGNALIVRSLEDAIETAKKQKGSEEIFIIGGGQIFKEALEKGVVDRLYLTIVEGDFDADTFFPDYSEFKKVINKKEEIEGDYKFKFLDLEK